VTRGKITAQVLWPGRVTDLDLDVTGNVKAYTVRYNASDAGQTYTYERRVAPDVVRTLRNGEPHDYDGSGAEFANPYGFCPAVWVKHRDLGGDHGAPAFRNIGKIDELNSLASHGYDQLHKIMSAPVLIGSSGAISSLTTGTGKTGATASEIPVTNLQEGVNILKGPADATVNTLKLETGELLAQMQQLIAEIEADHPELTMYHALRDMSQVTGPAAERLMGDVAGLVEDAQATYDLQSTKLFQMALAIGGWRANRGAWGTTLSLQQRRFLPFNLESYQRGDLDFVLLPRPLIPPTAQELMLLEREALGLAMDRQSTVQPLAIERRLQAAQMEPVA
jgi:hypothetical protein